MSYASNKFRALYLRASKSDIEWKITKLMEERVALLNSSEFFAADSANTIFQNGDQHTSLYDGENPGIFPWMSDIDAYNPFPGPADVTALPSGDYEERMAIIHDMDKALETEIKKQEIFLEAKRTEIESVDKLVKNDTEKGWKTFG